MEMRLPSTLPEATEAVVRGVIGGALEVHRRLGPGLLEAIYVDALTIELEIRGLRFERERQVLMHYRGRPLRSQRVDLIVEGQVIVEVKAVDRFDPVHQAQVLSYLRATGLRVGLLMNFHRQFLKSGLRRIVL